MRTPERSRWFVGEQQNIICRRSCSSFRVHHLISHLQFRQKSAASLLALDRPSNDLLKSSTVISDKGKPPLKRWSTRIGIGSPTPLRRIIDATT